MSKPHRKPEYRDPIHAEIAAWKAWRRPLDLAAAETTDPAEKPGTANQYKVELSRDNSTEPEPEASHEH